jgi:2-C-methyl-D-erythritol 4-phosphate cytidylyltransferase
VPRAGLWATQTPQIFRADLLKAAIDPGLEVTDDAAWLEARGIPVRVVPGDPANIKLTYPEDLEIAEALVKYRLEVGWCSGSG